MQRLSRQAKLFFGKLQEALDESYRNEYDRCLSRNNTSAPNTQRSENAWNTRSPTRLQKSLPNRYVGMSFKRMWHHHPQKRNEKFNRMETTPSRQAIGWACIIREAKQLCYCTASAERKRRICYDGYWLTGRTICDCNRKNLISSSNQPYALILQLNNILLDVMFFFSLWIITPKSRKMPCRMLLWSWRVYEIPTIFC